MSRVVSWLQHHENRMFCWVNQRLQHSILDHLFNLITHLGGATMTILIALCLYFFGQGSWKLAGLHCCVALALSHIPVAIMKRVYPRLRPYLVLPDTNTCKKPLTDHSFPSGHTTAFFSIALPLVYSQPWLSPILLPLAFFVAISRIYLGLHYPSDCLVGSLIATTAVFATAPLFG
ncbi:phosphatase PAP2 family protein [Paenibacillus sp. NPDC056579]|uniref:phosphatase PAP2 family protein n=1 Tax=Paenibacillus sp. NPDC056579 TaxID=3345871 RepID=UPI0036A220B8